MKERGGEPRKKGGIYTERKRNVGSQNPKLSWGKNLFWEGHRDRGEEKNHGRGEK